MLRESAFYILLLLCRMWSGACEQSGSHYVRPPPSADLSLSHSRLLRSIDAPHAPEQIHLAMAGVTMVTLHSYP